MRAVSVVVAVLFLFGPATVFLAGGRATRFENHALAGFPSLRGGWSWFTELPAWATDNLPMRHQAVRADTTIATRVFGQAPVVAPAVPPAAPSVGGLGGSTTPGTRYPQVIVGTDGFWYYGADIQRKCQPLLAPEKVVAGLVQLERAVRGSGRQLVVVAAPDKSDVMPEHLPRSYLGKDCAQARAAAMWAALDRLPNFIDLRAGLLEYGRTSPWPIYLTKDTHWNGTAATVLVRELVHRIQPDVEASFAPRALPPVSLPSDLGIIAGTSDRSLRQFVLLEAPSVRHDFTTVAEPQNAPAHYRSNGPAGTLVRTPTLLIGDSFISASEPCINGVFADLSVLHELAAPATLVSSMVAARTVVIEQVERELFAGNTPLLNPAFIAKVTAELAAHPI
jgi:hypothetical protein